MRLALLSGAVAALATSAPAASAPHGGQYRGPTPPSSPRAAEGAPAGDDATWSRWWHFNREPYLELKAAVHDGGSTSGGDGDFFLGRGGAVARRNDLRPTEEQIHDQVVPAILELLDGQRDDDVVTACLMALGKIGDRPGDEHDLVAVITQWLDHANQEVEETAALALGLLGERRAATLLAALMHDEREGRKAVGGGKVDLRTRTFATYGMALLGAGAQHEAERRFCAVHLVQLLESDDAGRPDLSTAAILGLGLQRLGDGELPELDKRGRAVEGSARPTESRQALTQFLLEHLDDSRLERHVRALVPVALVRLDDGAYPSSKPRIVDALVPIARGDVKAELQVRHGAIHALGLLGDDDADLADERIRAALDLASEEADRLGRYLSLVSLARVGAREGAGHRAGARSEIRGKLQRLLVRGQSAQRPWAALGLGLIERASMAQGEEPSLGLRLTLRERLAKPGSPSERGAIMTALGLIGDQESAPAIEKHLTTGDYEVRAQAALALGMMDYRPAIPQLMRMVSQGGLQPAILRDAAIALALMRHKDVVPLLLAAVSTTNTVVVRASAARALGYVGDTTAVEPLLEVLRARRGTSIARAFAVVALGVICDRSPFPWNSQLAQDLGWYETPPTLHEPVNQTGVVDLF